MAFNSYFATQPVFPDPLSFTYKVVLVDPSVRKKIVPTNAETAPSGVPAPQRILPAKASMAVGTVVALILPVGVYGRSPTIPVANWEREMRLVVSVDVSKMTRSSSLAELAPLIAVNAGIRLPDISRS
jgi:hypothetical protein